MSASDNQNKNLPASQRKLDKARKEGNIPRSQDFGHFAGITVGVGLLVTFALPLIGWLKQLLRSGLLFNAATVQNPQAMSDRLVELGIPFLWVVLPLGFAMMSVSILGSFLIGGWNFTFKALAPKFDKLNPLSGIGRLFSQQQFITAMKACLLAVIVGIVGVLYLKSHAQDFVNLIAVPLPAAFQKTGDIILGGMMFLLGVLALFAMVDVPLQKYLHASRLKMSHQELKQEYKEVEGNMEVKSRQKAKMREMSRQRMMQAVPQADLVVMNPTHYAVALKYDETTMSAPRVIAKGKDLLAFVIRDTATAAAVPVLQAPVLARALYAHAEIDKEIPAALFAAVAQVLAYVYQLRAALKGKGHMPGNLPDLQVPAELDPLTVEPKAT
jgi:flagellar biosynthesis protein FlhB